MYITQNCTANANQVCEFCQPNYFCTAGQYFTPCSSLYYEHVCVNCTPSCKSGYYQTGDCSYCCDIQCTMCDSCLDGSYVLQPCAGIVDTICHPCTVCAPWQYTASVCNMTNDAICVNCTSQPCGPNQFVSTNRTNSSDRISQKPHCGSVTHAGKHERRQNKLDCGSHDKRRRENNKRRQDHKGHNNERRCHNDDPR